MEGDNLGLEAKKKVGLMRIIDKWLIWLEEVEDWES